MTYGPLVLTDGEVWHTRDRRAIPYSEMEERHIRNTIAYLLRSAERLATIKSLEMLWGVAEDASDGVWNAQHNAASAIVGNPEAWIRDTPAFQALERALGAFAF